MTTRRNIATTISIGGSIAASLPSSARRAASELQRLKAIQAADVQEVHRLRGALRGLTRGTEEHSRRTAQLREVQERIDYRVDEIGKVGAAARQSGAGVGSLTRRLSALRAGAAPVALALGAVTGLVIAMGAAFSKAGREANDTIITADRFGVTVDALQRGGVFFRTFTQDAEAGRRHFESLLGVAQDFERVRFGEQLDPGRFLAATRLGIDVNDLIQGRLDPTQIFEGVVRGFGDLAPVEAQLRAEMLLGPELAGIAAAAHEQGDTLEEANRRAAEATTLSREQLEANQRMGQTIDSIHEDFRELLNQVVSFLVPHARSLLVYTRTDIVPALKAVANYINSLGDLGDPERRGEIVQGAAEATGRALFPAFSEGGLLRNVGGATAPALPATLARSAVSDGNGVDLPDIVRRAAGAFFPVVGRQFGGRTGANELTLVGEQGPEIARFPGGTEIIPNNALGRGRSSVPAGMTTEYHTWYVTINNPASELDIERALQNTAGRVTDSE